MSKNSKKFLVLFLIPALFLTVGLNSVYHVQPFSTHKNKQQKIDSEDVIIDSNCSLQEALSGLYIPPDIIKQLTLVSVTYYSFDGKIHKGQVVINKNLAKEIKDIFVQIKRSKFPVEKVIPIYKYKWNDEASMEDNNTAAFNFRNTKGTKKLSNHAAGRAIDINPKLNPQIKNGKISPNGSSYNTGIPGTISDTSIVVKLFSNKGWKWGGYWKHSKDYQHFEK